ncbi:MAG: phosphoadenosine phosphosulfate reductase family protein [Pyrobaculum sp.]
MRIPLIKPKYDDYRVFTEAVKKFKNFVVAYSGGKDSTAVAIFLYQWVAREKPNISVTLLYNDTLSEVNSLESWVRQFMNDYIKKARQHVEASYKIVTPEPVKTFFWRVFVRGYPAPTFVFRWCVDHLKLEPMIKEMRNLKDAILVTGQRDEESGARAASMKKSFGVCQPTSCLGAYFSQNGDVPKLAPIRFWTTADVWEFLLKQQDFDISPLEKLYGVDRKTFTSPGGRFGCWHCTLVKIHSAMFFEDKRYVYVEALRLIYKAISNIREMRIPKARGYSKLGPLTPLARSIIYHLVPIVEEKSGHYFYGLDEVTVDGKTLREIFYEMREEDADALILRIDKTERWIGMKRLREINKQILLQFLDKIVEEITTLDYTILVTSRAKELLTELT